ncbi:MAG TPA: arginase family protein [Nitrososphaerales archaeon]|nr:arginase family protein [Nitrososphaerales archaeon]
MERSALVGAPFYSLAKYVGMGGGPRALREFGILAAVGSPFDAGDAPVSELKADSEGLPKNLQHFIHSTESIRRKVAGVESDSYYILGGECSVAVGALAGVLPRFQGKPSVLWMDAHGDFNTPETSPSGYVGGMCLAMACGRGPKLSPEVDALRPLVPEEGVVHVGSRDLDRPEAEAFAASPARLFTAQQVKTVGATESAEEVSRHLSDRGDWVFCHIDVDVVDPGEIPAVNYPTPGGLTAEEAALLIRAARMTGKLRVLEVTSYNAMKDLGGESGRKVVELVRRSLS